MQDLSGRRRCPLRSAALTAAVGVLIALAAGARAPSDPAAEFRARDQALLDAIGTGNKTVWEKALSADAIYIDENGKIYSKPQLIAGMINPLPPHVSGHIDIASYRLQVTGDTALVVHKDDESETWHGHALKAQYIMSETWRRDGGAWKLAMVHVYVVPDDPPAVALPAARLDEYTGRYKAAPELLDVIARDGPRLSLSYNGRAAKPLLVESPDMLFVPGEPRFPATSSSATDTAASSVSSNAAKAKTFSGSATIDRNLLTPVFGADLRRARIVNYSVSVLDVRAFRERAVARGQDELLSSIETTAVLQRDNRDEVAPEHPEIAVQGAQRTGQSGTSAGRPVQSQTVAAVIELRIGYGNRPVAIVTDATRDGTAGRKDCGQTGGDHENRFHGVSSKETSLCRTAVRALLFHLSRSASHGRVQEVRAPEGARVAAPGAGIIEAYRATGAGWQRRVERTLKAGAHRLAAAKKAARAE